MLTDDLLQKVILEPAERFDSLLAVSGYVSASLALSHVFGNPARGIPPLPGGVSFRIVYGMYSSDGVRRSDDAAFRRIAAIRSSFQVRYWTGKTPIHTKLYVWCSDGVPKLAYAGSANYSQASFFGLQSEIVTEIDAALGYEYAKLLFDNASDLDAIPHPKIAPAYMRPAAKGADDSELIDDIAGSLPLVELPLYAVREERMSAKSGLNWGQRPGREPNQAYIPVPSEVAQSGFFPPRGDWFTVLTDDGQSFECTVAQDGDKAIETPLNNSILGRYFRERLGVQPGAFVHLKDLDRYGRRTVAIYRATEDRYILDFRRPI